MVSDVTCLNVKSRVSEIVNGGVLKISLLHVLVIIFMTNKRRTLVIVRVSVPVWLGNLTFNYANSNLVQTQYPVFQFTLNGNEILCAYVQIKLILKYVHTHFLAEFRNPFPV